MALKTMKTLTPMSAMPFRGSMLCLLACLVLSGCGKRPPEQYISADFVPAGMQRDGSHSYRNTRLAAGDPNVAASVKAHTVRTARNRLPR